MIKKYVSVPVLVLGGGAAAFALRLLEVRTGFEAATGLPIPGNLWRRLLVVLFIALAAALALVGWTLPDEKEAPPASFAAAFSTVDAGMLVLPAVGVFLMALSGAIDLGAAHSPGGLFLAATALLPALALFPTVRACRRPGSRQAASGKPRDLKDTLLLVPVLCLVVRLVLTYRLDSIDPALSAYYVELLAVVFLTLGFYRLSSFAFQVGRTPRFVQYAGAAVILCCAALADGRGLSASLLYAGGGLTLLGFLLLRLKTLTKSKPSF